MSESLSGSLSEHTQREWAWDMCNGAPEAILVTADDNRSLHIVAYAADEADMRLVVGAANSYRRHCGPNAVECAEKDLLGEALAACKAAKDLYDYLALGPLGAAAQYGPDHDYEGRSDEECLRVRGLLDAATAKATKA